MNEVCTGKSCVATIDRRTGQDRRQRSTLFNFRYLWGGSRKAPRRKEDLQTTYVDRYDWRLMVVTVAVLALCIVDAILTLILLGNGARELNLLMDYLIQSDLSRFLNVKLAITAGGMILLVRHERFHLLHFMRVKNIINGILALYSLLIGYELTILYLGA